MKTDDIKVKESKPEKVKRYGVKRILKDRTIAPKWCGDNVIATKRGWEDSRTGELYVSNRTLPLDEIHGKLGDTPSEPAKDAPKTEAKVETPAEKVIVKEVVKDKVKVKAKAPAKKRTSKKAPAKK